MIPTGVARVRLQRAHPRRDLAVDGQRVAEPREPEHRRLGGADRGSRRAEIATRYFSGSRSHAWSKESATPSSGASTYFPPVCGSTAEATSAIPRYGTIAATRRTPISRRRPARPIATWPARPEDASMPLNATSTSGNAKIMSSSDGAPAIEDGSVSTSGWKSSASPKRDDQQLQDQVAQHEDGRALEVPRARPADRHQRDVEHDRARDQELAQPVAEAAPEDAEVVRRGERAQRDEDQVVEADRPAGDEADELVERVAGDHRRAAALLVQRRALDVGRHDHREQHAAGQEDGPREPERALGDQPGREVDRGGDEALDDPEQRRASPAAA